MRVLFLLITFIYIGLTTTNAQQIDYNLTKEGYIAKGYDLVAYFDGEALKGNATYTHSYDGAKIKFSSKENLERFKANPDKYMPQHGGWCSYALALAPDKVPINPKTFEIRNGKLYLFYNKNFNNTLESWLAENPDELVKKADANWEKIKYKK